jgi:hypothetical protein
VKQEVGYRLDILTIIYDYTDFKLLKIVLANAWN